MIKNTQKTNKKYHGTQPVTYSTMILSTAKLSITTLSTMTLSMTIKTRHLAVKFISPRVPKLTDIAVQTG
jgi:hypothetical protein